MAKTSDSDALRQLAEGLKAVAPRLPAPAAERAADRLLDAMAKTSDSDALEKLAECFAAVAPRLPAPAAERAADRLLDAMAKTSPLGSNDLRNLAEVCGGGAAAARPGRRAGRRAGRRPTPRRHGQDQRHRRPEASWPGALRRWRRGCPPRPPSGSPTESSTPWASPVT